jgi:hypothetical protein
MYPNCGFWSENKPSGNPASNYMDTNWDIVFLASPIFSNKVAAGQVVLSAAAV